MYSPTRSEFGALPPTVKRKVREVCTCSTVGGLFDSGHVGLDWLLRPWWCAVCGLVGTVVLLGWRWSWISVGSLAL